MQTIVIYSSQTGNTRKLATQIFAAIPGDSTDLKNIDEYREKDAELYFVGFWVDRGDCDEKTVELLSGLHGKKIALFGESRSEEAAAGHGLDLLAEMPIDPKLASLVDAGKIEDFEGDWMSGVADAVEKLPNKVFEQ